MNIKILGIVIGIAIALFTIVYYFKNPPITRVVIGDDIFYVDLAVTADERVRGLSGREKLHDNQGMLFIFSDAAHHGFWMKEMKFPIDIIWINDQTIVDISKNLPYPENSTSPLPSYQPQAPADKVLEINAGLSDKLGINIGDTVQIKTK